MIDYFNNIEKKNKFLIVILITYKNFGWHIIFRTNVHTASKILM